MTQSLAPPPLQVPPELQQSKLSQSFFSGLINTIYQLWTSVYSIRTTVKAETDDDQNTAMIRVQIPAGKTVMIDARIVSRRTGGTAGSEGDSAFYVLTGAYKNIGGVLSGIGTPLLEGGEDQVSWNVGFTTAGSFAVVIVKGAVNNEITWEGTVSTFTVGS